MAKHRSFNQKFFLLSFFPENSGYSELSLNDFWLVKHWDGVRKLWDVFVYTNESFRKYKEFNKVKYENEFEEQDQHIKYLSQK